MRRVLAAGISAVAAAMLLTMGARHATRQAAAPPAAQPREARPEDLARDVVPAALYARAHSFWGETCIGPCMLGARWSSMADGAAFAGRMRISLGATAPSAAAAIARAPVELDPATAPAVRVLKFRPRQKPARPERRYDTIRAAA